MAEELQADRAVRRRRKIDAGTSEARPQWHAPNGRQSSREWRNVAQRPYNARLPRICGKSAESRHRGCGSHSRLRELLARRHETERGLEELPGIWSGRNRLKPS